MYLSDGRVDGQPRPQRLEIGSARGHSIVGLCFNSSGWVPASSRHGCHSCPSSVFRHVQLEVPLHSGHLPSSDSGHVDFIPENFHVYFHSAASQPPPCPPAAVGRITPSHVALQVLFRELLPRGTSTDEAAACCPSPRRGKAPNCVLRKLPHWPCPPHPAQLCHVELHHIIRCATLGVQPSIVAHAKHHQSPSVMEGSCCASISVAGHTSSPWPGLIRCSPRLLRGFYQQTLPVIITTLPTPASATLIWRGRAPTCTGTH